MKPIPIGTIPPCETGPASETMDQNRAALSRTEVHPGPTTQRVAFSVKETADMLGVSEKTVRRLVARGLLRSSKALRHLLIPKKEIDRFLEDTIRSDAAS